MQKQLQKSNYPEIILVLSLAIFFSISLKAQYTYLGSYDGNGKPNYLEAERDNVSDAFLSNIDASLPESKPVPTYNPHYISDHISTDIQLKDSAAVWVTFVAEGAGYRNVLGYYTYDLTNPPNSIAEINTETIVFPNVSARYSGGDLLPGDKVKLGNFSAGTGIGWFLIANGWTGTAVGDGNWKVYSNPDFNPESNSEDRTHNVLLNDANNERIVLGFEDIRRDYTSCDQDFNDAIFYISATPYSAITTNNLNIITDSQAGVSTGGDGGLESNGNLAQKIATRNFKRKKSKTVDYDNFESLPLISNKLSKHHKANSKSQAKKNQDLRELIPHSSLFQTKALETTPSDLLSITNAKDIIAADYVSNNVRLGAAMIMYTEENVYEHTKAVCDRLNGAELLEIIPIKIDHQTFLMFHLLQENGAKEYAINFVLQENKDGNYVLANHWSLNNYDSATKNYNFQIWSSTTSMTIQLVQDALAKFQNKNIIEYSTTSISPPNVYVKKGSYAMGMLQLTIANTTNSKTAEIRGNLKKTETSSRQSFKKWIKLSGAPIEEITIPIGKIFDIGLEIHIDSTVTDVLYAADGSWGTDYEVDGASMSHFQIMEDNHQLDIDEFHIERGVSASGTMKDYITFFKNILPRGKPIDLSMYNTIQFEAQGNQEVQLTLIKSSIDNWSEQFRINVKLDDTKNSHTINLNDLKNSLGNQFLANDIQSIAISLIGDEKSSISYNLEVNNIKFINQDDLVNDKFINLDIFPNPARNHIIINMESSENKAALVSVIDISGKVRNQFSEYLLRGTNQINLDITSYERGIYLIDVTSNGKTYQSKIIKK